MYPTCIHSWVNPWTRQTRCNLELATCLLQPLMPTQKIRKELQKSQPDYKVNDQQAKYQHHTTAFLASEELRASPDSNH
jgi:hypothetical protein